MAQAMNRTAGPRVSFWLSFLGPPRVIAIVRRQNERERDDDDQLRMQEVPQ
jgi:hypothetical protein